MSSREEVAGRHEVSDADEARFIEGLGVELGQLFEAAPPDVKRSSARHVLAAAACLGLKPDALRDPATARDVWMAAWQGASIGAQTRAVGQILAFAAALGPSADVLAKLRAMNERLAAGERLLLQIRATPEPSVERYLREADEVIARRKAALVRATELQRARRATRKVPR